MIYSSVVYTVLITDKDTLSEVSVGIFWLQGRIGLIK